tara:strand:+ start:94 stop:234 length:141 start_codon:yes stop_codon:yes gene_type:complete
MLLMTPMSVKRWESGKSKPSPLAMEALKKLAEENQNNEEDYSRSMF